MDFHTSKEREFDSVLFMFVRVCGLGIGKQGFECSHHSGEFFELTHGCGQLQPYRVMSVSVLGASKGGLFVMLMLPNDIIN